MCVLTVYPVIFTWAQVIDHIKAENAYCESEMSALAPLTDTLYKEMLQYLKESDEEVPYKSGDFEYYSKTVKGLSYTIHCRRACGSSSRKIFLFLICMIMIAPHTCVLSTTLCCS
jgi:protease II